jgi:hypothetical protein
MLSCLKIRIKQKKNYFINVVVLRMSSLSEMAMLSDQQNRDTLYTSTSREISRVAHVVKYDNI